MKKAVSLLLALVLCLGLAVPALAADAVTSGSCGQYTIWSFDKATGTLTISGKGKMSNWNGNIFNDPVPWQDFLKEIRTVVIEEGVTYIGQMAFCGCSNLTRVTIPKSVTGIGSAAFGATLWLQSLGEFAIANGILIEYQGSAEKVVIPDGVTSIGSHAFVSNRTVVSVTIPEGVTTLETAAFNDCRNLAQIDFPSTLRRIDAFCFDNTKWLDEQRKKDDLVLAGSVLLEYHGDGGDVVIPDGVVSIKDYAFCRFTGVEGTLGNITVPASMLDLNASSAFTSYWPPKSVTYKGGKDQWAKVEGTEWLTENKIPVRCTGEVDPAKVFNDMEKGAYYLDSVAWAVRNEIAMGTTATTFSPKQTCTHGQILTFLWRAAGEPGSSVVTPFAMQGDEYYYGAAKWAYERNMINAGFDPKARCSRVDAVNYIWQAMGRPYAVYDGRFTDLPANSPYAQAVAWAAARGVTTGATDTTFNPNGICNRGQIVTFLYRAYK